MGEPVEDDGVLGAGQCAHRGKRGLVARGEDQCGLAALERGQRALEFRVLGAVANDEGAGSGTGAAAVERGFGRGDNGGMRGQAEVIVGGERQDLAAVQRQADAGAGGEFQLAREAVVAPRGETGAEAPSPHGRPAYRRQVRRGK